MQNLSIQSKEDITSVFQNPTGYTGTVNGEPVHWILDSVFSKMNDISLKSLDRYRKEIEETVPALDHPYYFSELFGKNTMYSEKILEKRKYNKHKTKTTDNDPHYFKAGNGTLRETLVAWVKKMKWDYKCGASYIGEATVQQCHKKMNVFFDRLAKTYPDATITIFYTTERNPGRPGHHNHFAVSIKSSNGNKLNNVKRTIISLIKSIGSEVPECVPFDLDQTKKFIDYITKYVDDNPDSWWIHTSMSGDDFNAVFSPSKARTSKLSLGSKDGLKKP